MVVVTVGMGVGDGGGDGSGDGSGSHGGDARGDRGDGGAAGGIGILSAVNLKPADAEFGLSVLRQEAAWAPMSQHMKPPRDADVLMSRL